MKKVPPLRGKFTRGPWFNEEDCPNSILGLAPGPGLESVHICYVQELVGQDPAEVQANVELILAAPAMDNILRRILAQYRFVAASPTRSAIAAQAVMDLEATLQEIESFFTYPPDNLIT